MATPREARAGPDDGPGGPPAPPSPRVLSLPNAPAGAGHPPDSSQKKGASP